MQTDADSSEVEGFLSLLPDLTGSSGFLGSVFGGGSRPAPPPTRFRPHGPSRFGNRPQRPPFRRPPFRPRPPPSCGIFCKRRKKREIRKKRQIQHNILR